MNPPPAPDPQIAERVASTVELWAKIAGGVIGIWALLSKVWKPYQEHRREVLAKEMRTVLAPELSRLAAVFDKEDACAQRMERVLQRQEQVFEEFDLVASIMRDIHERVDETNELLDATGFTSDRRSGEDRRREAEGMLARLHERQTERKRAIE